MTNPVSISANLSGDSSITADLGLFVVSATFIPENGTVVVSFNKDLNINDLPTFLLDPTSYTIAGITIVSVYPVGLRSVALITSGWTTSGPYRVVVTASAIVALDGSTLNPFMNSAGIFDEQGHNPVVPYSYRSIYTNKGPIVKPPITLQTGSQWSVQTTPSKYSGIVYRTTLNGDISDTGTHLVVSSLAGFYVSPVGYTLRVFYLKAVGSATTTLTQLIDPSAHFVTDSLVLVGDNLIIASGVNQGIYQVLTVTQTTITITTTFPAATSVTYKVQDPSLPFEYMRVTAVSGTTLTVTRGINSSRVGPHLDSEAVELLGAVTTNEVVLPGGAFNPSHVGLYLGLNRSAVNGGSYKILEVLDSTHLQVQASFRAPSSDPDNNSPSNTWDLYDPRTGFIADDPSDLAVRVNGNPVTVDFVIGLLGQIVLASCPVHGSTVVVDYEWVYDPTVEIRRLNSREFRSNNGNNKSASLRTIYTTTLNGGISSSAVTLVVSSLTGFNEEWINFNDLVLKIDSDYLSVTNITGTTLSVFRHPTLAASHLNGATVEFKARVGRPYLYRNVLQNSTGASSRIANDDIRAIQPQPLLRDVFYRAYERKYTAALNDPNLLRLNTPKNRTAYPPLVRKLSETSITYDAGVLPEADPVAPWVRNGSGVASIVSGDLVVVDNTSGPFPSGQPFYWTREVDLSFKNVYAATWRMKIDATVPDGVFTGISTGWSDNFRAVILGYLLDSKVSTTASVTTASSVFTDPSANFTSVFVQNGDTLIITSGLNSGSYLIESATTTTITISGTFPANVSESISYEVIARKIGFLKRGAGNLVSFISSWTGGMDSNGNPTGLPVEFDWSIYHSYRFLKDTNGIVNLFVDGEAIETLQITEDQLPLLEELDATFNQVQNIFFGSLSREATSQSTWQFVRYLILPTDAKQTAPFIDVSYGQPPPLTVLPEDFSKPWTPIGYHGNENLVTIGPNVDLILDSTSFTSSLPSLIGGDFRGFTRIEPLLSVSSSVVLDFGVSLRTYTHGITPNAVMAAVDDGNFLVQVCFFPTQPQPKVSYPGRSLPQDATPNPWASLGGASAFMIGRTLRIDDSSVSDGRLFSINDLAVSTSPNRIFETSIDYLFEFQCTVISFVQDGTPEHFCGVTTDVFDGTRTIGLTLNEDGSGNPLVSFHSDGVVVTSFPFNWKDGDPHTYRITKNTVGNLLVLFIDNANIGSEPYTSFSFASGTPTLSFGSTTQTSVFQSKSVVDWYYVNGWRGQPSTGILPRQYVGIWKGSNPNSLLGYYLPTKASGRAITAGNSLTDLTADFISDLVQVDNDLVIDDGVNSGVYRISSVSSTALTIDNSVNPFPQQASTVVTYRIPKETDWTNDHTYQVLRDPTGFVGLFQDASSVPLIRIEYNHVTLPPSSAGLPSIINRGLPSVSWGAFDSTNLSQTAWDFVHYAITTSPIEVKIVPPHQVSNQRNVMASPEHLFGTLPHAHTQYSSASTGVPYQWEAYVNDPSVRAFTKLNEGTPPVPLSQTFSKARTVTIPVLPSGFGNSSFGTDLFGSGSLPDTTITIPASTGSLYNNIEVIEKTSGETDLLSAFSDEVSIVMTPNPVSIAAVLTGDSWLSV